MRKPGIINCMQKAIVGNFTSEMLNADLLELFAAKWDAGQLCLPRSESLNYQML